MNLEPAQTSGGSPLAEHRVLGQWCLRIRGALALPWGFALGWLLVLGFRGLSAPVSAPSTPPTPAAPATQTSNVVAAALLLEEGAWQEEIQADYNAALRVYETLLDQPRLPDRLRLEATYRMAVSFTLKGNLTPAVKLFLRVLREFPAAEPFAQRASENLLLLSPEAHPTDRSWYRDERLFLGDVALALDAALAHGEVTVVRELLDEALGSLRLLQQQTEGEQRDTVQRERELFEALRRTSEPGRLAEVRSTWTNAAERVALEDRTGLFTPDDLNAAIVDGRDRIARALQTGDPVATQAESERWIRFVDAVETTAADTLSLDYLRLVRDSLRAVNEHAVAARWADARAALRQSNRSMNRVYGAATLHVPGLADFPSGHQPEIVALLTWVEDAVDSIDIPEDHKDPVPRVETALRLARELAAKLPEGAAQQRLRQWAGDFQSIAEGLRLGESERARRQLRSYNL